MDRRIPYLQDMQSDDGACVNEEEAIAILLNILRVSTYLHRDAFIIVRDPIIKQGVFGIPLTGLIPHHMLWYVFVFNGLR